jgi:1,4-alpha-glucan branching enzyme
MTRDMDGFIERIAGKLREPMTADETFETRAMKAVRAASREVIEQPGRKRSWWMRRSVRLTPAVAFAMAAGIAAIAVAASLSLRPAVPAATVAAAPDTVHVVRFMLVAPGASQVALVGSFNQWEKGTTLLEPGPESGVWTVTMPLPAGRHEYAFVVSDANGERWVADRYVQRVTDEYGVESSVLSVGGLPTT